VAASPRRAGLSAFLQGKKIPSIFAGIFAETANEFLQDLSGLRELA
jgi:hypothetical protein